MSKTRKLVLSGLLVALGVILGKFSIPMGVAKCFPMQHFINVLSAVLLGPLYTVMNAFVISLLRNLLGVGSLLAFPGSMIGAFIAAIAYKYTSKLYMAAIGEIIGTGLIGSLVSFPIAKFLMGSSAGAFYFVIPFAISSITGALFSLILLKVSNLKVILADNS